MVIPTHSFAKKKLIRKDQEITILNGTFVNYNLV